MTDIRWKQRFDNYMKALKGLKNILALEQGRQLSEIELTAKIKYFEMVESLAIETLSDYLKYQGVQFDKFPKAIVKTAFNIGLFDDGQVWVDMIDSRNKAAHTYNESIASSLSQEITDQFLSRVYRTGKKKCLHTITKKMSETMDKFCLPPRTLKTMWAIFARYPQIEKVVVYGSRAMGNYRTGSDSISKPSKRWHR